MAAYRPSNPNAYGFGKTYKSPTHYSTARAARNGDWARSGLVYRIDLREIEALQKAFHAAGVGYERSAPILAQSLNRAGARIRTQLKRSIKAWTGIRRFEAVEKRMKSVIATPGNMAAGVRVHGRHFRITKADFGASWRGHGSAGVTHSAWNRSQTATGAFMPARFKGGSDYGGGLAFKRVGGVRGGAPHYGEYPIKPLWGPHPVREMQRREAFCRSIVTKEARWFLKESLRRAEIELGKAKARYGV